MKKFLLLFVVAALIVSCKKKGSSPAAVVDPVIPGTSNGCQQTLAATENIAIFPADNAWNKDISASPADASSAQVIARYMSYGLKADFGSGLYEGKTIGIPYTVVCGNEALVNIVFRANTYDGNYGSESDKGPYNIPLNAPIEAEGLGGDSHVIVLDANNSKLYELYNASLNKGQWEASSGAIFDLKSNALRTEGWTSADAAGLPIFPGLVRYEEILKGEIDHPIRFTLASANVLRGYVAPARHQVNSTGPAGNTVPFGARIRLKSNFDISSFSTTNQIILKAMKKYGLILADIGSNFYISGAPDSRWNNDDLAKLGTVKGANFEVVNFH